MVVLQHYVNTESTMNQSILEVNVNESVFDSQNLVETEECNRAVIKRFRNDLVKV